MINYKGIFYHKEKEKHFYEGGAHFKYSDLVNRINQLIKEKNKFESSEDSSIISNKINKNEVSKMNSQEKKTNSNLLTINTQKNTNNIKLVNNKNILTEQNIEPNKKNKLINLIDYNIKVSPFKNKLNNNNNKKYYCYNSIDKNNKKSLKNSVFNDNLNESNDNDKKSKYKNNLPPIQSSYFKKAPSNKNIFEKNNETNDNNNNNHKINLKQIPKFNINKVKVMKENLLLKNKILSPFHNINSNRKNMFADDFPDINKNLKIFETIEIYTKNFRKLKGIKLPKHLNAKSVKKY
jgi:hypothetical protein